MPRISIIIPTFNVEEHLAGCLESIVGQSLADIEVICVDDYSSDGTLQVLESFAEKDPRVRIIAHDDNNSASQARKDGVLSAVGEYIMFVDADDSLELDACQRLYENMKRDPVDILHFGTSIEAEPGVAQERIDWMEGFVRPYQGTLAGSAILEAAFSNERLYNFSLWDKLYSATLCKRAFSRVQNGRFPKAQDKYAYFLLSYFATSYRGISERYYRYHFGRGVTGHQLLTFEQFERYCSMGLVADAIRDFLEEESALQRFSDVYDNFRTELLRDCVVNWNRHLGAGDKPSGFDLMLAYWSPAEVVGKLAELNWSEPGCLARLVAGSRTVAGKPRDIRVIGTYYHRLSTGGVQRVLASLIALWKQLGYEVVLFTDEEPTQDDYDLPDGVQRIILPSALGIGRKEYADRARELQKHIATFDIDVMVSHTWVSNVLLWDLLVAKASGAGFVVHCHSVFSQPLRSTRAYFADMPSVYHLCDSVIALSEVDRTYWSHFNSNVVSVVNPLTFLPENVEPAELDNANVLWLGRISEEKRPADALRIFAKVVAQQPDARLLIVGGTADEELVEGLRLLIQELDIADSVRMCGFQRDVLSYYQRAAVFLMTSEFEGLSTALSESQSAGVPCVMYELPYMTLTREEKGFVSVALGDINAAADAVVDILRDTNLRKTMGRQARENVQRFADFDYSGTWQSIFEGLSRPIARTQLDETSRIMWETLLAHYRVGAVATRWEMRRSGRALAIARRSRKRMRTSWSFRVGYALMSVPRFMRRLLSHREGP